MDANVRWPAAHHLGLWAAFGTIHLALAWVGIAPLPNGAFGDVLTWYGWLADAAGGGGWPVLDHPWVYPALALLPLLGAGLGAGGGTVGFAIAWCVLVSAANALAVAALARRGQPGLRAAWWWLGFIALLGPVGMGRLDAVIAPMMIGGLLLALERPRVSSALLVAGAWIKVAPGALLLAMVLAVRRPWREVVVPAASVCLAVVAAVAVLGGAENVLSFVTQQDDRGLQVESIGATPWVLAALVSDAATIEFDAALITYEVRGPGVATMAAVLDAALPLALLAATAAMWRWRRARGTAFWDGTSRARLVTAGALALVLILLVTNKVLSPQFITWLGAPIAAGLCLARPRRSSRWRQVAQLGWAVAAMTQVVFPWGYSALIAGDVALALVLAVRNLTLLVALVAIARWLVASGPPRPVDPALTPPTPAVGEPGA